MAANKSTRQNKGGQRVALTAQETKQARSERTLERILASAEELLHERDFDQLTMADLASHAGCAVGTLYGRIPNKESLLACLYQRLQETYEMRAAKLFTDCGSLDLEGRVDGLSAVLVDVMVSTRGVNRAVTLHLWSCPHGDVHGFRRSSTASFKQAAAFLAECGNEIAHRNKREACEFGLMTVASMAQDRIVFGDRSGIRLHYSPRTLKTRLAALLLTYLRSPQ